MSQETNLHVIDADAHVIETEHTWDYLEASERKYRPRLFSSPDEPGREYWVIAFCASSKHAREFFARIRT